eukprot:4419648-Heterocapsa_arctica.AAC.1
MKPSGSSTAPQRRRGVEDGERAVGALAAAEEDLDELQTVRGVITASCLETAEGCRAPSLPHTPPRNSHHATAISLLPHAAKE